MSARRRAAGGVAAALVVVVVLIVALSRHHHRSAYPGSTAAPATTTATTTSTSAPDTPGVTPTSVASPAAQTTTTVAPLPPARGTGSTRGSGPFANGAPAALDVAAGAPLEPLPPPEAGWQALSVAQGNANGSYGAFHIASPTTQIRFRSSATSFHVYVVDQVQGREATAGYADVDCAGPCADLQTLSVPAGDYHVEVEADGPWELSLEQYVGPS